MLTFNTKDYIKNNQRKERFYGLLEDESGTISFAAWRYLGLKRNDIIRITNGQVKQWQGVLNINIDKNTEIIKITDTEIVDRFNASRKSDETKRISIGSLKPEHKNVSCICRIASIKPLEVKLGNDIKTVFKGQLADDTGSIRFTAWDDFNLEVDSVVFIRFASMSVWKGVLELNLNSNTEIDRLENESIPPISELPMNIKTSIAELNYQEYLRTPDISLEGIVLEIRNNSGLIKRCNKCSRTIQNGECKIHGNSEGDFDLRLQIILDDGTGAVKIHFKKDLSEKLIGKSIEDCIELLKKIGDPLKTNQELLSNLNTMLLKVDGSVMRDDFGISIIASNVEPIKLEPSVICSEAQKILETMEWI